MTERRPRAQMPAYVKALVAMMFGILAGGRQSWAGDMRPAPPTWRTPIGRLTPAFDRYVSRRSVQLFHLRSGKPPRDR